ncbi:MAG TPA: methyltransferase domain-containing protein, partial [Candidatus Binatia bacterium]|nr:methyltransferase domain-containing protein [Candidatus Binatia bacterium]
QNMLRSAREHLSPRFGAVRLVACDFLCLPFARAFDGIVSTAAFHWVLDHDKLFTNLHDALIPGGWLEAQCGGGPNVAHLRSRGRTLGARPQFAPYLADFREPWNFQDANGAALTLKRAGFIDVETSVESAPTQLEDAKQYEEFVRNIIFHRQLAKLPTEQLRAQFMENLTEQAAADNPPFVIDYWRLNLRGRISA